MRMKRRAAAQAAVIAAFLTLCLTPGLESRAATSDTKSEWQFEITPYLFGASLDGTVGIRGVNADVKVPLSELLQSLDSTFMATVEARKDDWIILFDGMYFRFEGEGARSWQGPLGIGSATGTLEATVTQQFYHPSLGYRVVDGPITVDGFGGVRYTQADTELVLTATTGPLLPDGTLSMRARKSWWDPVVGIRTTLPLAQNWSLLGYFDVGGFGVGSDITYQAIAGVTWQFGRHFSAKTGYRYLYQDFEEDGFVWDMSLQGFFVGLGIRF
jgi:hypothetical protein